MTKLARSLDAAAPRKHDTPGWKARPAGVEMLAASLEKSPEKTLSAASS